MGCGPSTANLGVDLIKAVIDQDLFEVKKKLQHGAPVNVQVMTSTNGPLSALYCSVATDNPDLNIFLHLIRAGAHVNVKCGVNLATPLMQTAARGELDMMKVLLQRGALVNLGDKDNDTALHYAAINEETAATALLLKAHANPNARNSRNRTPLHVACAKGDLEVIMLLKAAGASSYLSDCMGAKPADLALLTGNGAAVLLLLAAE